jgi:hypothetical protein
MGMQPVRTAALALVLCSLTAGAHALPFPLVVKANVVSFAFGFRGASDRLTGQMRNTQVLALGIGARVSPSWAVVAQATLGDDFDSYYTGSSEWPGQSLGVTVVRCTRMGPRPRAMALTATLRGSNEWGGEQSIRYVDLNAGANVTAWIANPSLEVGFHREWYPSDEYWRRYGLYHDYAYALVRLGLGGWYEFGRGH